jgi:non-heme Fe2+,alpha-ketoglutarate-dependent halogenase
MNSPKLLREAQIKSFRDKGHLSPVRVMSAEEATGYRAKLEAFERQQGFPLTGNQRAKTYLLFTWAYEVLTHPKVLDAVEDLIGPDILVYHWTSWIKEPRSKSFVSWHQDGTYFGLEPLDQVTAWVALSPATIEAGCMRVLPESHKLGQLPVDLRPDKDNLLSSGQTAKLSVADKDTVPMPLQPGEMSLHHTSTVHGSGGNNSDDRRIGFCLDFVPAHVKPNKHLIESGALCSALLVRGKLHHDYFPQEKPPKGIADPDSVREHEAGVASYRRMVQSLGHMTAGRFDKPAAAQT